jgi:hypothetical protein
MAVSLQEKRKMERDDLVFVGAAILSSIMLSTNFATGIDPDAKEKIGHAVAYASFLYDEVQNQKIEGRKNLPQ